jgi:hypothetical protein
MATSCPDIAPVALGWLDKSTFAPLRELTLPNLWKCTGDRTEPRLLARHHQGTINFGRYLKWVRVGLGFKTFPQTTRKDRRFPGTFLGLGTLYIILNLIL